jgi:electron transfer flavoprotein alpha subunit
MSTLLLVEHDGAAVDELSLQALTLAQTLGEPVEAVLVGGAEPAATLDVSRAWVAEGVSAFAPVAWARAVLDAAERCGASAIVGPGSDSGNEVMAHVAALRDLPFAANCIGVEGDQVTRVRWGGSLLEEARIHAPVRLLTAAPFALPAAAPGTAEVETFTPALEEADLAVQVSEHVDAVSTGVSLAEAKVVVSGGRGVGSAEGFEILEELAGVLEAAVGCSRVVTSAGWRPHTDQVGQTGTKVSPDLYIACGISGATQHIAGCKGAKKILAINSDAEAPILANADYAVIGDLTEIVPAITAELRKVRSP